MSSDVFITRKYTSTGTSIASKMVSTTSAALPRRQRSSCPGVGAQPLDVEDERGRP